MERSEAKAVAPGEVPGVAKAPSRRGRTDANLDSTDQQYVETRLKMPLIAVCVSCPVSRQEDLRNVWLGGEGRNLETQVLYQAVDPGGETHLRMVFKRRQQ